VTFGPAGSVGVVRAYVGIGANLGERERTIHRAIEMLAAQPEIELAGVSPLRETAPWGPVEQPSYLNGAVALDTELGPRDLLEVLLDIERSLGRDRSAEVRWGPRTLDLDLLVHGDLVRDEPGLTLPHPRLHERRFALEPLVDLDPELVVPGRGTVGELLASLDAGSQGDGQG
jgi:2-amino-4-hydroxy-6-hydroxymethyldihydropteridine diphosphokinase